MDAMQVSRGKETLQVYLLFTDFQRFQIVAHDLQLLLQLKDLPASTDQAKLYNECWQTNCRPALLRDLAYLINLDGQGFDIVTHYMQLLIKLPDFARIGRRK